MLVPVFQGRQGGGADVFKHKMHVKQSEATLNVTNHDFIMTCIIFGCCCCSLS